jgi:DNA-binding MarR family transcriptional regulator
MDKAMAGVKPEICNGAALRQAARHVTRLYDDALAPIGIGLNQFSVLARMSRVGPSPVQELARHLVMDRSTLGHLLRPLEDHGLVRLRVSKEDRRSRVVMLTAAGKALLARALPLWAAAQARFESAFGEKPALNLRTTLKRIATSDFDRSAFGHGDNP